AVHRGHAAASELLVELVAASEDASAVAQSCPLCLPCSGGFGLCSGGFSGGGGGGVVITEPFETYRMMGMPSGTTRPARGRCSMTVQAGASPVTRRNRGSNHWSRERAAARPRRLPMPRGWWRSETEPGVAPTQENKPKTR